jgi:hypothetical protein
VAQRLAAERDVADGRTDGRACDDASFDMAATPEGVGPADLIVLHRVVSCYPDFNRW